MVGLQTLDLAIGVRVPASQPIRFNKLRDSQYHNAVACGSYGINPQIMQASHTLPRCGTD